MKKNLITILTVAAMLSTTSAVFADTIPATEIVPSQDIMNVPAEPDTPFENEIQGDIMPISASVNVISPSYMKNAVTVTDVTDTQISTTLNAEDAENLENTVNYTITDKTIVLGFANGDVKSVKDIKKGDKITVYSNAYAPAPLIMPPQYQADVIVVEDADATINSIDVDTYVKGEDEMLVNISNTLALNIAEDTEIVDREGKKADAKELDKKDLAVIYSASTKSIPAQTTPIKVVVLGENEMALKALEAANATPAPKATPEATPEVTDAPVDYSKVKDISVGEKVITNIYKENDTLMVPLREIAETLGFTVEWDGATKSIMLNGGIYSLKIGENAYGVGKMMPQQLKTAPVIKDDDLTYVPVEYFTELLEANDSIVLNYETAE